MAATPPALAQQGKALRLREPFSGLSHLLAALAAVPGLFVLGDAALGNPARSLSLYVFGVSLLIVYAISSAMHLYSGPEPIREFLNRCDHAAIYLFCAGTYTPFVSILPGPPTLRALLQILVWASAGTGIAYKLTALNWKGGYLSVASYAAFGFMLVPLAAVLFRAIPASAIGLIVLGGLLYGIGGGFYVADKMGQCLSGLDLHDVWHVWCVGGSIVHFVVMATAIAQA